MDAFYALGVAGAMVGAPQMQVGVGRIPMQRGGRPATLLHWDPPTPTCVAAWIHQAWQWATMSMACNCRFPQMLTMPW